MAKNEIRVPMTVRRLGRPPIPPAEVRARHVRVPVNAAEGAALDAAAKRAGKTLAGWARDVLVRVASRRSPAAPESPPKPAGP